MQAFPKVQLLVSESIFSRWINTLPPKSAPMVTDEGFMPPGCDVRDAPLLTDERLERAELRRDEY